MRNLLSAFYLLICLIASGQEPVVYNSEELKEDFRVFQGSLEDFHPGLYWYRDKEEMDGIFEKAARQLKEPLTEREFYRILSAAVAKVGCGHTYTSLSEKTEEGLAAFLPFQLQFIDQKAYFIKTYGEQTFPIQSGNQITQINGTPMDSIYSACLELMTGDGFTISGKINMLNAHFWYTYAELFEAPASYDIQFSDASGISQAITVPAIPQKEMYAYYFAKDDSTAAKRNVMLSIENSVATLKIKSFFGWKEGKKRIKIENKFKEVFETLEQEKVTQLIIDLRENGGGRVPWVMYAYFVDEPFLFAKNADLIFSKSSPYYPFQKLHPAMKFTKNKWLHRWLPGSSKMSKMDDSRYEMTGLYMTKPYKPEKPKFEGEVYILTNGGTFSAASDFAAMMKSSGLATIIGVESGGGYYGNTSMEKSYVTLPNSKLEVEIPLVRHQLKVDSSKNPLGRGVIPDHEVVPSLEDVINGVDGQMNWTLNYVKQRSQ